MTAFAGDTQDLSALTAEQIHVQAQNEAVAYEKTNPGLSSVKVTLVAEREALEHNLRGAHEFDFWVYFKDAYLALESKD